MSPLREKVSLQMRLRGFSPRTHESYLHALIELARFYRRAQRRPAWRTFPGRGRPVDRRAPDGEASGAAGDDVGLGPARERGGAGGTAAHRPGAHDAPGRGWERPPGPLHRAFGQGTGPARTALAVEPSVHRLLPWTGPGGTCT